MEMIERDVTQRLLKWKNSPDRKPLIVRGVRQIGKSWAVEDFGNRYYEHLAVFNFDRKRELAEVFAKTKDPERIIRELGLFTNVPLLPEKTLLFFDEIQECKEALNALKYFCEEAPAYHIITAGSLLGVAINEGNYSFPVGKVNFMQMHPVNFKEYLRAADKRLLGALAENFVLTSLLAQGFDMPNYWTLQGNKAKVDFLVAHKLSVVPIEVKSDRRISGKSFAEYDKKYHPELRIRFSMNNIKKDGNLLNLPIFMADWLREYLPK